MTARTLKLPPDITKLIKDKWTTMDAEGMGYTTSTKAALKFVFGIFGLDEGEKVNVALEAGILVGQHKDKNVDKFIEAFEKDILNK